MVTVIKTGQQAREVQRSNRVLNYQEENKKSSELTRLKSEGYTIEQQNNGAVAYKTEEYNVRRDYEKDSDPSTWKINKGTYRTSEITLNEQGQITSNINRDTYTTRRDTSGIQRNIQKGVYIKSETTYTGDTRRTKRWGRDGKKIYLKKDETFVGDTRTKKARYDRTSERKNEPDAPVVGAKQTKTGYIDTATGYKLTGSEIQSRQQAYKTAVKKKKGTVEFERLSSPRQHDTPMQYMTSKNIHGENRKDLTDPTLKADLLSKSKGLQRIETQIEKETEGTKDRKEKAEKRFQDWRFKSGDYFGGIDTELRTKGLENERKAYDNRLIELQEKSGFKNTIKSSYLKLKGRPDKTRKPTSVDLGLAKEQYDIQQSINTYQGDLQLRVDKGTMSQSKAQHLLDKSLTAGDDRLKERAQILAPVRQIETSSYDYQDAVAQEKGGLSMSVLNLGSGIRNVTPGSLVIGKGATGKLATIRDYSLGNLGRDISKTATSFGRKKIKSRKERDIKVKEAQQFYSDVGYDKVGKLLSKSEKVVGKVDKGVAQTSFMVAGGAEFITRKPLTAVAITGASAVTGGLIGAGVATGGATAVATIGVSTVAGLGFGTAYGFQVKKGIETRDYSFEEQSKYLGAEATKVGLGIAGFRTGYKYTTTAKVTSPIKYKYTETKVITGKDVKGNLPLSRQQTGKLETSYTQKVPFQKMQNVKTIQQDNKFVRTVTKKGGRTVFTQQDGVAQLKTFKGRKLTKTKTVKPIKLESTAEMKLTKEVIAEKPLQRFSEGDLEGIKQVKGSKQTFEVKGKNYYGKLKTTRSITKIDTIGKGTKTTEIIDFKKFGKDYGTRTLQTGSDKFKVGIDVGKTSNFKSGITSKTGKPTIYGTGKDVAVSMGRKTTTIPKVQTQIIQTEITTGNLHMGKTGLSKTEQGIVNLWTKEKSAIKKLWTPGKSTKGTQAIPATETFTGIQTDYTGGSGLNVKPKTVQVSRPDTRVITTTKPTTISVPRATLTSKFTPTVLMPSTLALGTQSGLTSLTTSTSITGLLLSTGTQPVTTSLTRGLITSQAQTVAPSQVTSTVKTTTISAPGTAYTSKTSSITGIRNVLTPGKTIRPNIPGPKVPIIPPPIIPGFLPIFGFGAGIKGFGRKTKRKEKYQRSFTAISLGIKTRKQAQDIFGAGVIVEEKGKKKKYNLLGLRI